MLVAILRNTQETVFTQTCYSRLYLNPEYVARSQRKVAYLKKNISVSSIEIALSSEEFYHILGDLFRDFPEHGQRYSLYFLAALEFFYNRS
jgi:hypothetical protein